MQFIGRYAELEVLEKEYARSSSFVVVYGRRRVGKTTLIKQFIKEKNALYFLASEEGDRQNLNKLTEKLAEYTMQPHIEGSRLDNWLNAFRMFAAYKPDEKKILVIDEFQYLVNVNSAFPSIFQEAWDEILKDNNVMVILCGSHISMMTAQVLAHSSPLYGRRTSQIRLQPLKFSEFSKAFPDRTFAELVELYAVTGGVPKYIEFFDNECPLWENISDNILNKSGFLYEEPIFLLDKEVREPVNYFSIMKAIAFGNHKLSKIAGCLEQKTTSISPYLATLTELFLVEKRIPVTERIPEKSKRGLYYISDNFIRFWFRYVYTYRGELEMDNISYVLDRIQASYIENHVSFVFEDISKEIFAGLCMEGAIDFVISKIGSYWNSDTEIDIVAVDNEHDRIFVGECKYYNDNKPVTSETYYELREKCRTIPEFQEKKLIYGLFSISGFDSRLVEIAGNEQGVYLIDRGRII